MMDAAAKKVWANIKAKKYEPVYILQGEETYYIDLISNYLEEYVLSDSEKGFNQVVLYGKDVTVANILTQAKRFPMMADRQVVIVKEAQDIQDLQKDTGIKLMLSYLANPLTSTILVLCHKHKTLDKRKELGKKADQLAVSLTFKKPYENQLPEFITGYVSEKGFRIEDEAVRVLAEYVGNDLSRLANEIDKVLIDSTKETPIKKDTVMSLVGMSKEYNIFELQKALINNDVYLAARIVAYIERNTKKNPVIPMVAFLYSFFSKVLIAVSLRASSEKELVTALKISPFAARDYSQASRRYSIEKVIENISLLKQADLKLKGVNSGSETEGDILKELIFRLM
jgi:DNA polymerase III subunit delta